MNLRFIRQRINEMITAMGLADIAVSDGEPFWHAIGKKN